MNSKVISFLVSGVVSLLLLWFFPAAHPQTSATYYSPATPVPQEESLAPIEPKTYPPIQPLPVYKPVETTVNQDAGPPPVTVTQPVKVAPAHHSTKTTKKGHSLKPKPTKDHKNRCRPGFFQRLFGGK